MLSDSEAIPCFIIKAFSAKSSRPGGVNVVYVVVVELRKAVLSRHRREFRWAWRTQPVSAFQLRLPSLCKFLDFLYTKAAEFYNLQSTYIYY